MLRCVVHTCFHSLGRANAGGRLHFLVFLFMFYDVLGCSSAKSFPLYAVRLKDGPLCLDVPLSA